MITESVYKTKTVLNKMMDLAFEGVAGDDLTAALLCECYDTLRKERRMKPDAQYFSDLRNGQRCIKKWRNFDDPQTPATFEKYLVLSAIFGCDFRDIVYFDNADARRKEGAYSFSYSFETAKAKPLTVVTDLPCIRDKMGKDGIDRFGFIASDEETAGLRRKLSYDGRTVLDRAIGYLLDHQLEASAGELIEKLDSVIFAWKTRRAPLSMGLILMFEEMMGIDILEMYVPQYLEVCANLSDFVRAPARSKADPLRSLKAGSLAKEKIRYFLQENGLEIYKIKNNCIVTRLGDRYGLILAGTDGIARHIPPRYEYVAGNGEQLFAIDNDTAFRLSLDEAQSFSLMESAYKPRGRETAEKEIFFETIRAIINGGYRYFLTEGGLIVMSPEGNAAFARLGNVSEKGRTVKIYEKGHIRYGLIVRPDFVIPPVYDREIAAGEGIYTVKKQEKYLFLNSFGIPLETESYDDASAFSEGLCAVRRGCKYGYIDALGRERIPFRYDYACDFREGLAAVTINGKDGYIDLTGRFVIPPAYTNAYRFCEGVAVVQKGDKYGYIDKQGREVLPCIYDCAASCRQGRAWVISCGNLISKPLKGANSAV